MKVGGVWLTDPRCQRVFSLLSDKGFQAFVVGGAVRDAALGMVVGDVDFATDARPERVMELANSAGIGAVPTGIDHGTVTLVVDGAGFEVTTYRRDVQTDGRRAVVAFADDMETDARRRDFTMNALYADAEGRVSDPIGGWQDAMARHVRFIDDAETRIREDALRILRFFRFAAWFGAPEGGIDADGLAACATLGELVDDLSAERVGHEMRKLLSAPDPAPALAAMGACGVLARVAPGAQVAMVAPLVAVEGRRAPDWMRRLVVMGVTDEVIDWRLSKAEAKELARLRAALDADESVAASAYRHGVRAAENAALIRAASLGHAADNLADELSRGAAQSFPVRSSDILDRFGQGPRLGRALTAMKEDWIASDFSLSKQELIDRLNR